MSGFWLPWYFRVILYFVSLATRPGLKVWRRRNSQAGANFRKELERRKWVAIREALAAGDYYDDEAVTQRVLRNMRHQPHRNYDTPQDG